MRTHKIIFIIFINILLLAMGVLWLYQDANFIIPFQEKIKFQDTIRPLSYRYNDFLQHNAAIQEPIKNAISHLVNQTPEKARANVSTEKIVLKELKGGMTSTKLYVFELNQKKYVLRTLNIKHNIESRQNEIAAHRIAANLGIAPEITYVDDDLTLMIMPFIEGHTLTKKDLQNEAVLKTLGQMLGTLHHYKAPFPITRTQVGRVQKHYERAMKKGIALPTIYPELYAEYIDQSKLLETTEQVLTHSDLNPANIIISKEGKISIIDWTSATRDNRYTDLGYFTFNNGLNDEQSKIFLNAYFNRNPTEKEWEQFKFAQKRTSFLTATVWFDFSESEQDKLIPIAERIKKLDAMLESDTLKLGQDYIEAGEIISPQSGRHQEIQRFAVGFLKTYVQWQN